MAASSLTARHGKWPIRARVSANVLRVLSLVLAFPVLVTGCTSPPPRADPPVEIGPEPGPTTVAPSPPPPTAPASLMELAEVVRMALVNRDGQTLAAHASTKGVRFTPYAWVSAEWDVVLKPSELRGAFEDPQVRTWGTYDGRGNPIDLTFADYVKAFVTPDAFVQSKGVTAEAHSADKPGRMGSGNTRSNLGEAYPDATWVELYVPGRNPDYEGMDWVRLALVFVREGGTQKLRALVHDEWTI